MKKLIKSLLVVVAISLFANLSFAEEYMVFIVSGQSNASGQGLTASLPKSMLTIPGNLQVYNKGTQLHSFKE
jgi:hypothetical protein